MRHFFLTNRGEADDFCPPFSGKSRQYFNEQRQIFLAHHILKKHNADEEGQS